MREQLVDVSEDGEGTGGWESKRWLDRAKIIGGIGLCLVVLGLLSILFLTSGKNEEVEIIPAEEESKPDIVVDVAGAVQSPNMYILEKGARVNDALVAAGGLAAQADRDWVAKSLNLARLLKDGEKIFIKALGQSQNQSAISTITTSTDTGTENCLVNLNTASAIELDKLPGIGAVLSQRILDYRYQNGSFTNIEDLLKISGISNNLFNKVKDKICL